MILKRGVGNRVRDRDRFGEGLGIALRLTWLGAGLGARTGLDDWGWGRDGLGGFTSTYVGTTPK